MPLSHLIHGPKAQALESFSNLISNNKQKTKKPALFPLLYQSWQLGEGMWGQKGHRVHVLVFLHLRTAESVFFVESICQGKGRFSCPLLWMKNQLRLKFLDLNIPLHMFLFATCRNSSRGNGEVTGFSRVTFLAWGPNSGSPCSCLSGTYLLLHTLLLPACWEQGFWGIGSSLFFHRDQKFCFRRKTFCICRAEKYIISQLQTIFNIKFQKKGWIFHKYI